MGVRRRRGRGGAAPARVKSPLSRPPQAVSPKAAKRPRVVVAAARPTAAPADDRLVRRGAAAAPPPPPPARPPAPRRPRDGGGGGGSADRGRRDAEARRLGPRSASGSLPWGDGPAAAKWRPTAAGAARRRRRSRLSRARASPQGGQAAARVVERLGDRGRRDDRLVRAARAAAKAAAPPPAAADVAAIVAMGFSRRRRRRSRREQPRGGGGGAAGRVMYDVGRGGPWARRVKGNSYLTAARPRQRPRHVTTSQPRPWNCPSRRRCALRSWSRHSEAGRPWPRRQRSRAEAARVGGGGAARVEAGPRPRRLPRDLSYRASRGGEKPPTYFLSRRVRAADQGSGAAQHLEDDGRARHDGRTSLMPAKTAPSRDVDPPELPRGRPAVEPGVDRAADDRRPAPRGRVRGHAIAGDDLHEAVLTFDDALAWRSAPARASYQSADRRPSKPTRVWFKSPPRPPRRRLVYSVGKQKWHERSRERQRPRWPRLWVLRAGR